MSHDFPGNIRELENIIEHAFVLCRGHEIRPEHLPLELRGELPKVDNLEGKSIDVMRDQAEATSIMNALRKHKGNRSKTAVDLGIDKTTLWRKMKKLGITWSDRKDSPS